MNTDTCHKTKSGNILTPQFTLSYPNLFKPQERDNGSMMYNCVLIFDDDDADISMLKEVAKAAAVEKWGDKLPANLRIPFRDGEEKIDIDGYGPGKTFFSASSKNIPDIRTADNTRTITEADGMVYPGAKFRATVSCFAYEFKNKQGVIQSRGVSFGLRGLQFLGHGDALGGGGYNAEDDFESVDSTDDDSIFD